MSAEKEDYLIEVFFQETRDTEPDTDFVFSVEEAEEVVLDFYNEKIQQQLPNQPLLETYQQLVEFKKHSASLLNGAAWFRLPDETQKLSYSPPELEPEELTEPQYLFSVEGIQFQAEDFFTDFHTHFVAILKHQQIAIEPDLLEQSIRDALWKVLAQEAPQTELDVNVESLVKGNGKKDGVRVLLVLIADDDIAVYMDDEYIDSAPQHSEEDVQVIIDTANILADKFKTEVSTHYFKKMVGDWSWTQVENVLKTLELMPSDRKYLLAELQKAGLVKVGNQVATHFELDEAALLEYSETGETDSVVLSVWFGPKEQQRAISLTLSEVVNASEITDNIWICNDLSSTELTVLPRRLMAVDTGRLLR